MQITGVLCITNLFIAKCLIYYCVISCIRHSNLPYSYYYQDLEVCNSKVFHKFIQFTFILQIIHIEWVLFDGLDLYSSLYYKLMLLKDKRSCTLCGKVVDSGYENGIVEIIDGETYTFDCADCVLMFKKFRSLYGHNLFNTC